MSDSAKTIASIARELQPQIQSFLQDIVRIPSMNGDESKVLSRVEEEMRSVGYENIWYDEMGNLFGSIGSGEKVVAIDGHCDTVAPGNEENWGMSPFSGHVEDGKMYGRGSCDQKGGVASALYAGKVLNEVGLPEEISFLMCATVLEEDYEGISWKHILSNGNLSPHSIILTEPTDLEIKIGQRGRLEMQVITEGISSHGSAPDNGENAIYKAAPIISEVEMLNKTLESDSILGKGSITISDIKSTAPSLCAVADSCTIHLDRRLTEGETIESCLDEIRNLAGVRSSGAVVKVPTYNVSSYTKMEMPQEAYYPAWLMSKDDDLVRSATSAYKTLFDSEAKIDVWQFSTNGVTTKGMHNIPTIGFGPGNEREAHTPNEYIRLDDLWRATAFYTQLVRSL